MLREFLKSSAAVVLSTGLCPGVILYKSKSDVVSISFVSDVKAIKFYNICCRYMEKHNRHIKHDIDQFKFAPFKNFVV